MFSRCLIASVKSLYSFIFAFSLSYQTILIKCDCVCWLCNLDNDNIEIGMKIRLKVYSFPNVYES